jgi:anaphase-promoting complex subunit 5
MSLFAGVGGAGADPASVGGTGRALLELTPHKVAVCHLVQVFAPPAQAGGDVVPPFPFETLAHHNRHNRLGLFLFTLTRVPLHARLLACSPPRNAAYCSCYCRCPVLATCI